MALQWTDSLSVGNAQIDSDHKNLISMVITVQHALRSGDSGVLTHAFQLLQACVGIHLSNEERLARALQLPFDTQWKAKQHQRRELDHVRAELVAKSGIYSESAIEHFSHFLSDWMACHIECDQTELTPVLASLPYHFKP